MHGCLSAQVGPLLLGLLLTLSCVNAVSHDHDDDHDHDHDHDNGFHAIQHRLDAVVARIQRLRQKVGRRTDDDMINKARSLRVRVQHIEGRQHVLSVAGQWHLQKKDKVQLLNFELPDNLFVKEFSSRKFKFWD